MAQPTSREAYKQYCLRNLGSPVIDINVDDEQLEDRIDEALQYYRDYHYDGTIHDYVKHQITAEDITNQYITIGEQFKASCAYLILTIQVSVHLVCSMYAIRFI